VSGLEYLLTEKMWTWSFTSAGVDRG